MKIRPLSPTDAQAFRTLRLQGLEEIPQAFGESASEFATHTVQAIAERIEDGVEKGDFI